MKEKDVIVVFPAPSEDKAKQWAKELLQAKLGFVVRVRRNVWQAWIEPDDHQIGEAEIATLRVRTSKDLVEKLYNFIKRRHPWPVFCFEIFEISTEDEL